MPDKTWLRRVSAILQRAPWLASLALRVWQLRQARFSAGVAGVVFNATGQVLLVEHVFHPHAPWGLPGGWVDRWEDPAQALRREMREELELDVSVGTVLLVELDYASHLDLSYLCVADGSIGTLSSVLLDYGWFDPAELPPLHRFHYRAIVRALEIQAKV
jgi:ADP-ribose pyrophosphatase YjhB (NUDIX family)